jgi:hypothetical protein
MDWIESREATRSATAAIDGDPAMDKPPRTTTRWIFVALSALACASVLSLSAWSHTPNWSNADSLFYQAMSIEVDGVSAHAARARVFDSMLARPAIIQEPSVAEPSWQAFESQFFRRRWLVPALAATIRPLAGERALPDIAIVGYLLFGMMLCLLLASRFALALSLAVVILCLALGPTRDWGVRPMTDSWGLALSVAAICSALVVLARGHKWLGLWIATMLALSFTRDLALIPLGALVWLMYRDRDLTHRRAALILILTGVLATIPAYLLFGASLRLTLASVIDGFEIPSPAHSTWTYVAKHYPHLFFGTVKADLHYAAYHPLVGLTVGVGLVALFALRANRDTLILLMRGAVLGWLIVFAIDPVYTGFRYELTILAPAAVGLCSLVEHLRKRSTRQQSATPPKLAAIAGAPGIDLSSRQSPSGPRARH